MTSPSRPDQEAIDVHSHFVPPEVIAQVRRQPGLFPSVKVEPQDAGRLSFRFAEGEWSPTMPPEMVDTERRISWLRDRRINTQLCAPWTDLFGYRLPADEGAAWSRFFNEELAANLRNERSLLPVATVPLQDPKAAIEELEAARGVGCRGVMIGTATPQGELDDPALEDFWSAAASLGMPVLIHPTFLHRDPRLHAYGLANAVGRARETLLAVSRLLFSGVLLRHDELSVIVAHGGGGLPSLLGRLRRNHELAPAERADPVAGFHRLYFDSVVIDQSVLRDLVERAGGDRVLLGSDYPFPWEPDPRRDVEQANLDPETAARVLGNNARMLFDL